MIHNPIAGLANRPLVGELLRVLEARGAHVIVTSAPPDVALARTGDTDAVIAAGGDGTIRLLASLAEGRPIGIVPVGTGNVMAAEIGLVSRADALADVLMHGPVVSIEGARANGQPFYLMAGAGFDGEIVARLDTKLKRRLGKAAYVGPVLKTLSRAPVPLRVTVDGIRHDARWLVAAKSRCYGGKFTIAPDASLLRPGLEVVLMKRVTSLATFRQLIALGLGRLSRDPDVEIIRAKSVHVEADVPVKTQVDGDVFDDLPLTIEDGGPRFNLIVPPTYRG